MRPTIFTLLALSLAACGSRTVPNDGALADRRLSDGLRPDQALPPCGDPKIMAAFKGCQAATTQADCEQAGGEWTRIGLGPDPHCLCPTGQASCPCTRRSDCLGSCVADMPKMWECPMTQGTCTAEAPVVGCRCWFWDGTPRGLCVD